MKASRDLADAPRASGRPRPGERAAQRMLAFHHVQADGLVADRDQQADGLAGRDRQRRHVRLRFMDQGRKTGRSPRPAALSGPYSPSCSATKPQREQRHLPVQRALRQAGLFGQRRDAEAARHARPAWPAHTGRDPRRRRQRVGCQDSSPNELERRLSIYGFDPANYSRKLRITRENPSKYEKNINKAVASQAKKRRRRRNARRAPACAPGKAGIRLRPGARWTPGCAPRNAPSTAARIFLDETHQLKAQRRAVGSRAAGKVIDGLCSRDQMRMKAELPVLLAGGASPSVDGMASASTSRATSWNARRRRPPRPGGGYSNAEMPSPIVRYSINPGSHSAAWSRLSIAYSRARS